MSPVLLDTRPPGVNASFRPGTTRMVTLEWPAGSLAGRTFTSTLDGVALSLVTVDDTQTITVTDTQTAAHETGASVDWLLLEDIGGMDEPVMIGTWTASDRPAATTSQTLQVVTGGTTTVEVTVLGGTVAVDDLAVAGDLTMAEATIAGGTATNGTIRRTQSVQVPWSYSQTVNPTDRAIGIALGVDVDVNITATDDPFSGPQLQAPYPVPPGGSRGVVDIAGVERIQVPMTTLGPAPIGYADTLSLVAQGAASRLTPGLGLMYFRGYLADGRSTILGGDVTAPIGSDPAGWGAAFYDGQNYITLDGGTLDGTTDDFTIVSFASNPGLTGNVDIFRRIGLHVVGTGLAAGSGAHWSGQGTMDGDTPTLAEDIGIYCREFDGATVNIGLWSEPPAVVEGGYFGGRDASDNLLLGSTMHATRGRIQLRDLVSLLTEDKTLAGTSTIVDVPTARTLTMTSSGLLTVFQFSPTVVFEDDANIFGAGFAVNANLVLKNATGEPHALGALGGWTTFQSAPLLRGDGAALTAPSVVGFRDGGATDNAAGGTVAVTDWTSLVSAPSVGAGGTVTTRRGVQIADAVGAGTLATNIGVDIAALAKGATNIGVRNASTYVATPSTAQIIDAAGDTILANAEVVQLNNNTGGPITLTSAPTIANGQDGQVVELINVGVQNIVLQDQGTLASSNLRLTGTSVTLGTRDSVRLRYNTTVGDWVQVGPVVNVL